jgi:serine/threonine protein kinase
VVLKGPPDNSQFEQDLHELTQEIGERSKCLVPILGSFWHQGHWSLILPHARCTLSHLLEHVDASGKLLKWGYRQLYGITGGIKAIHSYAMGARPDFTIHGNINLNTILCYGELEALEQCVLVVSHFPQSAFDPGLESQTSPGKPTFWSSTYRPPEWDVEGGCVSKSSDIWSLGCAYLEFVTWLLGGRDLALQFKRARHTPCIDGTLTDNFYTVMLLPDKVHYVQRVKTQVTEASMNWPCRKVSMLIEPVDPSVATP